jgi:phosphoserine / homoserine phosphotransferase
MVLGRRVAEVHLVCLDLEGVLVPEIWIAFSEATGIPELKITTRDEPDYDKLMKFRIGVLRDHGLKLADIQRVIGGMDPLPGALEFVSALRKCSQFVILSDTFTQFAAPLMAKLGYPTLFCNELRIDASGAIVGYELRQKEGKRKSVEALKSLNFRVFAAGDSFNDLSMIRAADGGCLFRAPASIKAQCADLPCVQDYAGLLGRIEGFLGR